MIRRLLPWLVALAACGPPPTGAGREPPRAPFAGVPELPAGPAPARPARLSAHAAALLERFDEERAMVTVRHADAYFRVRGNEGYLKTLEHVRLALLEAGFPAGDVRTLELGPERPTWTPRRASVGLVGPDGTVERLHGFERQSDPERTTLLVGSTGTPTRDLEVFDPRRGGGDAAGRLVLSDSARSLDRDFATRVAGERAAGVLVRMVEPYHRPEVHRDTIPFGYLPSLAPPALGFSLSPAAFERVERAAATGRAIVRVQAEVEVGRGHATTVELTIRGARPDAPAVVFFTHVDEPGAHDNASGVAALLELARAVREASAAGALPALEADLVLLWGQEMEASRLWLERREPGTVAAGLVMDMVGGDPEVVAAPFRIERMPDPGAIWTRPPDEHSEWGATTVDEADLRGHALPDHVAAAAAAVAALDPPWRVVAHPFEGGSDHESFLDVGLPAVLAWHFTDDAYHTSRDRADRVSGREMRRVAAALGAVAVAIASGAADDEAERLRVVEAAAHARLRHVDAAAREARAAGSPTATELRVARAWLRWYDEALASCTGGGVRPARARLADAGAALEARIAGRAR